MVVASVEMMIISSCTWLYYSSVFVEAGCPSDWYCTGCNCGTARTAYVAPQFGGCGWSQHALSVAVPGMHALSHCGIGVLMWRRRTLRTPCIQRVMSLSMVLLIVSAIQMLTETA